MERSEAERMYRRWQADMIEAEQNVESWQRKAAGYRKLVEGLQDMFPDIGRELDADVGKGEGVEERPTSPGPPSVVTGDEQPQDDHPRGSKAVIAILAESPDHWFTVREVAQEMETRGWRPDSSNPEDAVRAALARAVKARQAHTGRRDGRTLVYQIGAGEEAKPGTVIRDYPPPPFRLRETGSPSLEPLHPVDLRDGAEVRR